MVAARRDRVAWMRQGVPSPVPAAGRRTATREVEPSRYVPTAPRGRGRGRYGWRGCARGSRDPFPPPEEGPPRARWSPAATCRPRPAAVVAGDTGGVDAPGGPETRSRRLENAR